MFTRQLDRTQQLLNSFLQKPLAPSYLFSTLEAEINSLNSIHTSYKPLILAATQLLKKEPSFDGVSESKKCMKRSLLPFLGDALKWLTGTATTKNVNSIKTRTNQLISMQYNQQETLFHIISILNITRYATQVNRQHISIVMSAAEKTHRDVTTLYSITHSLYSSLSYQPIVLHICSTLANLWHSLYYMREVAMHPMDYIDAATTGILSPHVLPVEDLWEMLHLEETIPSTMDLPISSEDALHFYRYLHTHVLIADEQFLLLLDVPIQECAQQLKIYEVFNLDIPHRNFLASYSINNRYLVTMEDETKAVEISKDHFKTCQKSNGQFCSLITPLLPPANPTTCVSALYTKDKASIKKRCSIQIRKASSISIPPSIAPNVGIITSPTTAVPSGITLICPGGAPRTIILHTPIHVLWLQPAYHATSQHFHLPPHYESHEFTVNISLNTANLNIINISSLDFRIWQHLQDHWNGTLLHQLVNISSVPIDQLYKQMVNRDGPISPFMSTDVSVEDTVSIWTLFSHAGIYVTVIGSLIPAGLGIFCCYFFWCWSVRLVCWPLQSGSIWYTIVDDNVEAAPIYRGDSKA